jgi:hypothetical protein
VLTQLKVGQICLSFRSFFQEGGGTNKTAPWRQLSSAISEKLKERRKEKVISFRSLARSPNPSTVQKSGQASAQDSLEDLARVCHGESERRSTRDSAVGDLDETRVVRAGSDAGSGNVRLDDSVRACQWKE